LQSQVLCKDRDLTKNGTVKATSDHMCAARRSLDLAF
jgi:hypothetical protein